MTVSLTSEQIVLDRIKIDPHREPDEEIVRQLMQSIPVIGVLQPIILRRPSPGMGIYLVSGLNRIEALKRLKQRATLARVVNGDSAEIKAWVAQAVRDENLIRRIHVGAADPTVVSLIDQRRARAS